MNLGHGGGGALRDEGWWGAVCVCMWGLEGGGGGLDQTMAAHEEKHPRH